MSDTFKRLEAWSRKYYMCNIQFGPHIFGHDTYVKLENEGKVISVDADESRKVDEDGDHVPWTLEETINEALDRWEKLTIKNFRAFIKTPDYQPPSNIKHHKYAQDPHFVVFAVTETIEEARALFLQGNEQYEKYLTNLEEYAK